MGTEVSDPGSVSPEPFSCASRPQPSALFIALRQACSLNKWWGLDRMEKLLLPAVVAFLIVTILVGLVSYEVWRYGRRRKLNP